MRKVVSHFDNWTGKPSRVVDRRVRPSHGYRAVDVIVFPEGVPVEIQVRTEVQNNGAQIVERLADHWGARHPVRRTAGERGSAGGGRREDPTGFAGNLGETFDRTLEEGVADPDAAAIHFCPRMRAVFKRLIMRFVTYAGSDDALTARFAAEDEFADDRDIEVVVLGAASEEVLRTTHGRYFKRTKELAADALNAFREFEAASLSKKRITAATSVGVPGRLTRSSGCL